jgi:hypothetical protein
MWFCPKCECEFEKPNKVEKWDYCPHCGSDECFEVCGDCTYDGEVVEHCEDCGKPLCNDCKGEEFGVGLYYCSDCRPVEDDGQRCPHERCGWEDEI